MGSMGFFFLKTTCPDVWRVLATRRGGGGGASCRFDPFDCVRSSPAACNLNEKRGKRLKSDNKDVNILPTGSLCCRAAELVF